MKKFLILPLAFFLFVPGVSHAAISLDNSLGLQSSVGEVTSFTYSYTTSGFNRLLIVRAQTGHGDNVTGVTYDGTPMILATKEGDGTDVNTYNYFFYLKNPAAGTHDVVISLDGTFSVVANTSSYDGALQTGGVDVATPYLNSTPETGNITVDVDVTTPGSWLVGGQVSVDADPISVVNGSFRGGPNLADSDGPVSSGTQSIGFDWTTPDIHTIIALAFAPATTTPPTSTPNRLAKFTDTAFSLGDSLLSDDGSNTTLTSGNLFMQVNSMIDTIANGALNFGTTNATTMTFGRSGQNMIINSNVGIATSSPSVALQVGGDIIANMITALSKITFGSVATASNCNSVASPAVCGSAAAGSVALPNGGSTLVVNTTAVTANSQILITEDSSLGSRLGITCNTVTSRNYSISARTPGTSFTIKSSNNPANNKACLSYLVIN